MQRTQIAHKKGHRRTKAELREMRTRLNARVEELIAQGIGADLAIQMGKAEENARREQEILEQQVREVLHEQLMAKEVEGTEVSEADIARMEGEDEEIEVDENGEPLPPKLESSEAQMIAKGILSQEDIVQDMRRAIPTLQATYGDIDTSGTGTREWDRRPEENEAWYMAFAVYLHLPPLERGVGAAYRSWSHLVGRVRANKTNVPIEWYRAAQKYAWEVRAAEYDKTRTQRFVAKMETAEEEIEDEMANALILAMRKCVEKLKTGRIEELSFGEAVRQIPPLIEAIRKQLGIGAENKVNLDTLMQALPAPFRQQVLLYMPGGTVRIDGKGVERSYDGHQMRAAPLADLTLPDRSVEMEVRERGLEKQLRELEMLEGELIEVQKGAR